MSTGPANWQQDGQDWPNRAQSQFPFVGGFSWHVQLMGSGPVLLLLHGTGASTHSFRDLLPLLARHFTVVAPDLPGHAFTQAPRSFRPTLPAMAAALGELLEQLKLQPALAVGHSAGAAIACRMALDEIIAPRLLVSLCGAFLPFGGGEAKLFSSMAKLAIRSPLVARLVSWRAADRESIDRLVQGTGSRLDARGVELYQRLARRPGHVAAVLEMMANWDLVPLVRELPELQIPLLLLAGENDRAVPAEQSKKVAALVQRGSVSIKPGAGHLLHEEQPEETARAIVEAFAVVSENGGAASGKAASA